MKARRQLSPEKLEELKVLRQLIDPKVYADFGLRAKEWSILKRLRKRYAPIEFWQRVKPAIPLDTLLYFYGFGAEALEQEWKEYLVLLATQKMVENQELDRNIEKLERQLAETPPENKLDIEPNKGTIQRKLTALEWAD